MVSHDHVVGAIGLYTDDAHLFGRAVESGAVFVSHPAVVLGIIIVVADRTPHTLPNQFSIKQFSCLDRVIQRSLDADPAKRS